MRVFWHYMTQLVSPIHMHTSMFTKSIKFLASEEQAKRWLPLIDNFNILGCYAQTEMGHGSNVAGIETTATFDIKKNEWVIHTPSIRAYKFWPGNLGRHSTHAVTFARVIVSDNDYGVLPFMIPIRSRKDHLPYSGVKVGDIGTKMGYDTMDNGYLAFDHYRVPADALLKRFVNVDSEGNFELRGDPRAIY